MKTKLEMAHEYALEMLKRGDPEWRIVTDAWNLADAMWIENNEREDNDIQGLSQEEWKPDWSQAPDNANYWAMDKDGDCYWYENMPILKRVYWLSINLMPNLYNSAPSFDYTGYWKESLRERPE